MRGDRPGIHFATRTETGRPRKPAGWKPANKLPLRDPTGDRRRVAALLAGRGPLWGDAAAESLGWPLTRWWAAANGVPWFTFDGPGPAGWTLTARGRAEALGEPA